MRDAARGASNARGRLDVERDQRDMVAFVARCLQPEGYTKALGCARRDRVHAEVARDSPQKSERVTRRNHASSSARTGRVQRSRLRARTGRVQSTFDGTSGSQGPTDLRPGQRCGARCLPRGSSGAWTQQHERGNSLCHVRESARARFEHDA